MVRRLAFICRNSFASSTLSRVQVENIKNLVRKDKQAGNVFKFASRTEVDPS